MNTKTVKDISKGVCTHINCLVFHSDGVCTCDMRRFCTKCTTEPRGVREKWLSEANEMPPMLLDDDIADWEHDNLVKNG